MKSLKVSKLTIILISILLGLITFVTVNLTSAFFANVRTATGQITLGEINFQIVDDLGIVITQEPNYFMPNEYINNSISFVNARDPLGTDFNGLSDTLLRVKPSLTLDLVDALSYLYIELNTPGNWTYGADGYYYYNNVFTPGQNLVFNNYFTLSHLIGNDYYDSQVNLSIEVEALQTAGNAHLSLWTTAPASWVSLIGALI